MFAIIVGFLKKILSGRGLVPSPPDIVKKGGIVIKDGKVSIDLEMVNIPFLGPPEIVVYPVMDTKSMDGIMDYGNEIAVIAGGDADDQAKMIDWIASQWEDSKGLNAADCAYRIPADWNEPPEHYLFHRLVQVGHDNDGRYFRFRGVNTKSRDPFKVRDENIKYLGIGVIY